MRIGNSRNTGGNSRSGAYLDALWLPLFAGIIKKDALWLSLFAGIIKKLQEGQQ